MPTCIKIKRKKKQPCIGDMDTQMTIYDRNITPGTALSPDFDEVFSGAATAWALVDTVNGLSVFDSTNTEVKVSHSFVINYDVDITAENWVRLNDKNYDIITTENLQERGEFLVLYCNERGSYTKKVNLS